MKRIYTQPRRDLKAERVLFLEKYAIEDWKRAKEESNNEISNEHPMKCVCGQLCTGLHETYCQKFKNAVTTRAIKKLKHLWKEEKATFPVILELKDGKVKK